jgi:prefoldin subunit 5
MMRPLLPMQPVTRGGEKPSQELIEVIQRMQAEIAALKARVEALEALHP